MNTSDVAKQKKDELRRQREAELLEKKNKIEALKKMREDKKNLADNANLNPTGISTTTTLLMRHAYGTVAQNKDILAQKIVEEIETAPTIVQVFPQQDKQQTETPQAQTTRKRTPQLTCVYGVVVAEVVPKEVETYSKEVQTSDYGFEQYLLGLQNKTNTGENGAFEDGSNFSTSSNHQAQEDFANESGESLKDSGKELSTAEVKEIINSKHFEEFFTRATKLVERAINQPYDVFIDYAKADSSIDRNLDTGIEKAKYLTCIFDEKYSKNRTVTSLDWSQNHPELFLGSYYSRTDNVAGRDAEGLVCLWSMFMPQRPEYVFTSPSPVSVALFNKHQPTMIVGGTYSGQILIWDTREKSSPVLKTPFTSQGHTHPIFGMKIVGTKNAHNLVTSSTDGRVCVWSLDKLTVPVETMDLYMSVEVGDEGGKVTKDVNACALAFPDGEVNKFMIGSEDGSMYAANRHGSTTGIFEKYEGHFGPITGMDCHPHNNFALGAVHSVDFSDLVLTSSVDWTCKLWSQKSKKCLYSFEEFEDYVYDVKWSPTHPAIFATVDGSGKLAIWNLNEDTEVPIYETVVTNGGSYQATGPRALNRVCWSHDGRNICIGDSAGHIHVYELDKEFTVATADDTKRFESKLLELSYQTYNEL